MDDVVDDDDDEDDDDDVWLLNVEECCTQNLIHRRTGIHVFVIRILQHDELCEPPTARDSEAPQAKPPLRFEPGSSTRCSFEVKELHIKSIYQFSLVTTTNNCRQSTNLVVWPTRVKLYKFIWNSRGCTAIKQRESTNKAAARRRQTGDDRDSISILMWLFRGRLTIERYELTEPTETISLGALMAIKLSKCVSQNRRA